MRKRWLAYAAVITSALVHCGASYKPLDVAEGCACRTGEYCSVSAGRTTCHPLPVTCGTRATCDCIGSRADACRDEDGRITLFPTRDVPSCDQCSSQEYCSVGHDAAGTCRVLPPECAEKPTCACFLGNRGRSAHWECNDRSGHIVASAH